MPHDRNFGGRVEHCSCPAPKVAEHLFDGDVAFLSSNLSLRVKFLSLRISDSESFVVPVPLQLAFPEWSNRIGRRLRPKLEQRALLAA